MDLDPQSSLTFSFYRPKEWNAELKEKRTIKRWFDEFVQDFGDTELSDLVVTPPEGQFNDPPAVTVRSKPAYAASFCGVRTRGWYSM